MKPSSHATQPIYYKLRPKLQAREQIVLKWRELTGLYSIPPDQQYWTLCNLQPNVAGSEIVELEKLDLLTKSQFYGVDYDFNIIETNKVSHPEAHWFNGDLLDVIDDNYNTFRPALIYYDSIRTVITISSRIYLAQLLDMCVHPGIVVAANLMLSNGHSGARYNPHKFMEELAVNVCDFQKKWEVYSEYYNYKSSRTDMGTYILYRK